MKFDSEGLPLLNETRPKFTQVPVFERLGIGWRRLLCGTRQRGLRLIGSGCNFR